MAEFVQQNLEEMIPELEQLQRVQIFSPEEVKQVIKKRKRFEYKIQKRNKNKEDFLSYIQYESSLLSLITIRREKIDYHHKKDEIDYAIARRINKLFKILEHRFGDDIKIWNSHIEFLKNMNWKPSVGKIYRRFIQVHVQNVQIPIAAAKYELEVAGNAETARKIMLEAIRFHPKSTELYREYFRLELIYVDLLRKRSTILNDNTVSAEFRDKVLEGEIVLAVLRTASEALPDAEFLASLLFVIASLEEPQNFEKIRTEIIEILREKHSAKAEAWDALAREALYRGSTITECCRTYEEGLSICEDQAPLLEYYLETLLTLPSCLETEKQTIVREIAGTLVDKLDWGHTKGLLREKFYSDWSYMIQDSDRIEKILQEARVIYPKSEVILFESLKHDFKSEKDLQKIIDSFFDVIKNFDDVSVDLWQFMFANISASGEHEELAQFYRKAISCSWLNPCKVRVLYFDYLYTVKGLEATRQFYDENKYTPPFDLEFHLKALELESAERKPDMNRIRSVYETAIDQNGKTNLEIWLHYLDFETKHGSSSNFASVFSRAETFLDGKLKEDLRTRIEAS